MQILTLDKDRVVVVDGNNARILKKTDLQSELERANYNINALGMMITQLESKVAPTDVLEEKQVEAIKQFNDSLGIDRYRQELDQFKKDKVYLEAVLK